MCSEKRLRASDSLLHIVVNYKIIYNKRNSEVKKMTFR